MLLTIQIVNYNSRRDLVECLEAIQKDVPRELDLQVVVINNEAEKIGGDLSRFPHVEIIETGKNIGFGQAHNLGAKSARGECIFFLNPDANVLPGALKELISVVAADKKVGIVGPLIMGRSGFVEEEHCGRRKDLTSLIKGKIRGDREKKLDVIFEVDWLSGGAMLIRRDLFESLGGFDDNFFMYFEDVDLCLRARKKNQKIVVNSKAKVLHKSGRSFASHRIKKKHYYASQDYYLRKHFGPMSMLVVKMLRWPYYIKNVWLSR